MLEENTNVYVTEKSIPKCPENYQKLIGEDQIYKIGKSHVVFFFINEDFICKKNPI